MTIYEKIENIFEQESVDQPDWAKELLTELRDIKLILQRSNSQGRSHNTMFYDFVNSFRKSMMADIQNNIYPEVEYNGDKLGVNFKGLLYYKATGQLLQRQDAIQAYKYLYNHKRNIVQ